MAAALALALTQGEATSPYTFKVTGLRAYSFEEALYHCRDCWKQTAEDFLSDEFNLWVNDKLGLPQVAASLRELRGAGSFAAQALGFLTLTGYYAEADVAPLADELARWEARKQWEKLKDRADDLAAARPLQALALYRRAIDMTGEPGAALLNNAGAAALRAGRFDAAAHYLGQAFERGGGGTAVLLNYIEALIYDGDGGKAEEMLKFARSGGERAELWYFEAELEFRRGNYSQSVPLYEQALAMAARPEFALRLADAYLKLRRFDQAMAAARAAGDNAAARLKEAEVEAARGNLPAAARAVERALAKDGEAAALWVALAGYLRRDYRHEPAERAAARALELAPDDASAQLEFARVRKAQGKIKEYQVGLRKILAGMKREIRGEDG